MSDSARQILPVIISILVIIAIAALRAHSKALAAITVTMPLNIPLAVWIIASSEDTTPAQLSSFTGALLGGLGATVVFTVALWLAARAGFGLVPMLAVAYLAWALTLVAQHVVRTYVL